MELNYKLYDLESNEKRIADAGACGERTVGRGKGIQTFCVLVAILLPLLGVIAVVSSEGKDELLLTSGMGLILSAIGMYPLSGVGKLIEAQGFLLLSETRHEMARKSGHS